MYETKKLEECIFIARGKCFFLGTVTTSFPVDSDSILVLRRLGNRRKIEVSSEDGLDDIQVAFVFSC